MTMESVTPRAFLEMLEARQIPTGESDSWQSCVPHEMMPPQTQMWVHTKLNLLLIVLQSKETLRVQCMRNLLEFCETRHIKHVFMLLAVSSQCTARASSILEPYLYYRHASLCIEVFEPAFFWINVCKHELVPPHRIMKSEDVDLLLMNLFGYIDKQALQSFPNILITDPVCRYLGVREGDVVEIDRASGEKYYRVCIYE